ncbi:LytR/AlgR family response regulator transcription factor [Fulvivirga sedimenti]|jgi:two-component system LytT family response regulator|uniref:LytTR family transcriptional regulator DNA-binding domain-containing protein n=1 Tax=Fulvivirga sedimenti TaxID=2879465 RepID=A0A9X1HX06_9BACT|nr:LytTR family transcriptional regulator DNA-binding domain-containing protein [Fulvivirga sedimenti]MCA6078608.1 LytTR family transcriptional regulator DNA-binding domain-containing protein [Fulvivirga sedimenti]
MIRILIIDDEPLARSIVLNFLKDHPEVEVVGECINGFEGLKAIQELQPDIVFLDVQMPKLSGFELLELLDELPVIVFSTAFDEYAIKAFELSAADYLLKPFTRKRFDEALGRAIEKLGAGESRDTSALTTVRQSSRPIDRIAVRNGTRITIIGAGQIDFIEAQDDYVAVHAEGKKYLKQLTMKYLEESLPSEDFVRVHRSYLVSVSKIDRIEAYSKDSYVAILKGGDKIPVSRKGYQLLRDQLGF